MKDTKMKTKVFGIPLSKEITHSEDGHPLVRGKFTSDQKDMLGDIITKDATENAIGAYRQWGNIRYMHQPRPVGKVSRIGSDDDLDWNEVEIKVLDPDAAFQVENGLLSALSVGISFGWDDFELLDDGGWQINSYTLAEISLVDHPANYDAKLDLAALPEDFRDKARSEGVYSAVRSLSLHDAEEDEIAEPEVEGAVIEEKDIETEEAPEAEDEEPTEEKDLEVEAEVETLEVETAVETEEEFDVTVPGEDAIETEEIAETEEELDIDVEESIEDSVSTQELKELLIKQNDALTRLVDLFELFIHEADEEASTPEAPVLEEEGEDSDKSADEEAVEEDTTDRVAELEAANAALNEEVKELQDSVEYLLSLPKVRPAAVQVEEINEDEEDAENLDKPEDLRSAVGRYVSSRSTGNAVIRRRRT
jgi:hypothetical protein